MNLARQYWEEPTQIKGGYLRPVESPMPAKDEPIMVAEIRTVDGQSRIVRWVRL